MNITIWNYSGSERFLLLLFFFWTSSSFTCVCAWSIVITMMMVVVVVACVSLAVMIMMMMMTNLIGPIYYRLMFWIFFYFVLFVRSVLNFQLESFFCEQIDYYYYYICEQMKCHLIRSLWMIDHVSIFSLFGVCVCVSIFILMFRIKKNVIFNQSKQSILFDCGQCCQCRPIFHHHISIINSNLYSSRSSSVSSFVYFIILFVDSFCLFFQLQSNSISNFRFDNLDGYESRNNEFRMK